MSLSVNINLAQRQKLVMTQTLREAIELLQVTSVELAERIEQELQENPVLEVPTSDGSDNGNEQPATSENVDTSLGTGDEGSTQQEDIGPDPDFAGNFEDSSDEGYLHGTSENRDPDAKQQFLEGALQRSQTLSEHLVGQLRLVTFTEEDFRIGEIIISCLDENGYFRRDLAEVAVETPVKGRDGADFARVLALVQTLDPPGIAAGSLAECLLLQLRDRDVPDLIAEAIIENHFALLEKRSWRQIATKLGVTPARVEEASRVIASLEPLPGRSFATHSVEYIVPDVIVREEDGEFVIIINDDWIPKLSISKTYRNLMRGKDTGDEVKTYITDKLASAQWLIRSIEQRRDTLYAVTAAILDEQRQFFVDGPGHLRPLTLKQIAERINMHESTVSRVTSNKYVQTGWGIYRLKYFFSSALKKDNGQVESSRSVKDMIRKIVEEEDDKLSDQDIVGILQNRGIQIARRTVAKYRKMLHILPASKRHS